MTCQPIPPANVVPPTTAFPSGGYMVVPAHQIQFPGHTGYWFLGIRSCLGTCSFYWRLSFCISICTAEVQDSRWNLTKNTSIAKDFQVSFLIFYDGIYHHWREYLGIKTTWALVLSNLKPNRKHLPNLSFFSGGFPNSAPTKKHLPKTLPPQRKNNAAEALLSGSTLVEVVGRSTVWGWAWKMTRRCWKKSG